MRGKVAYLEGLAIFSSVQRNHLKVALNTACAKELHVGSECSMFPAERAQAKHPANFGIRMLLYPD